MEHNFTIRSFSRGDLDSVKNFTDKWIGAGYYKKSDLEKVLGLSSLNNESCSLLAFDGDALIAVRLTYAPGTWASAIDRGLTPANWQIDFSHLAYFKSLFVHGDYQGKGLGKILSNTSIDKLKQMNAKGILCHSWVESPNDSSRRYLKKMGFEQVAEHPEFWKPIDYHCTRCAPDRCVCTAAEMILYI